MDRFLSSYTATRLRLQLLRNGLSKVLKDPTARIEAQFGTKASKPKAQGGKKKGPPASGAGASPVAAPAAADAKGGKKKFRVAAVEETPRLRRSDLPSEPVLPAEGRDNILITSALPYVNNVPHLGNLIGCVLSADVYARWCRQRGLNALYICGTDEYGTATETKAREEGLTPREVCDKYHAKHKAIYDWFDIRFDYFGRTSHATPKDSKGWPQTDIGQEIFTDCLNSGNLLEKSSQQVFCAGCDKFLSDRLVEGICPNCGHEDARGDQCPSCDALLNATDLKSPRCMVDKAHKLEVRDTEHMYLDLPKQDERLRAWLNKCFESGRWTSNAVSITQNWLKAGLQPRPITRDLKWGTPVPMDKFSDKVFYVWFDAPIGYISMTSCYLQDRGLDAGAWKAWWQNPDRVRLVQFMGKDNVPFHSVVFPGSLIATEKKWTLVGDLSVTEYLQYESGRFSKSKGVGVFGDTAKETGIPSEVWRFYLLSQRPENSDTEFSWSDFADNVNNVLLKNLGNFVNRALNLSYTQFEGAVPGIKAAPGDREAALETRVNQLLAEYNEYVGKQKLRHALGLALLVSGEGNTYLQDKAPWDLKKQGKMDESATAIAYSVSLVRLVAAIFEPYMPGFTDRVCHQLGLPHMDIPDKFEVCVPEGHKLGMKPRPIFTQIQPEQVEEWRSRFGGSEAAAGGAVSASDASKGKAKKAKGKGKGGAAGGGAAGGGKKKKGADRSDVPAFSRLLLKVGQITKVWEHPEKDRLFCEEVDVGEGEPRTIASGLRDHYKLEELQGRKIVVVANLKDRKMGDFTSKGMVLCANKGDRVEFVDPPAGSAIGERVIIDGTEADADEKINPQKKKNPWKEVVPELSTDGDKQACYAGKPLRTAAGVCTVPSLDGATLS